MLSKLHIQNYAIIDDLQIDFSNGLNIITGETGAGKSIVMGALNLILGQRADSSVLQQKDKKCVVEGSFTIAKNKNVREFFLHNDLDNDHEIIIRREIAANGKSRSFINRFRAFYFRYKINLFYPQDITLISKFFFIQKHCLFGLTC